MDQAADAPPRDGETALWAVRLACRRCRWLCRGNLLSIPIRLDFEILSSPVMSIRVCHRCSEGLTQAANAMRHHASLMHQVIEQFLSREPTEEQRRDYTERLIASLNEAQAAWDAYREHLKEHGLPPQT